MIHLTSKSRNVHGLESGTLMRMLVEYRRAGELLQVCGAPGANGLQESVREMIEQIEGELARRGSFRENGFQENGFQEDGLQESG